MSKNENVRTKKARNFFEKYEIISIDKIQMIKEKLKKNLSKSPAFVKIRKTNKILYTKQNILRRPKKILSKNGKKTNNEY